MSHKWWEYKQRSLVLIVEGQAPASFLLPVCPFELLPKSSRKDVDYLLVLTAEGILLQ